MIARADIDLVVVTVKLAHHHTLVAAAIAAGKMVMCEWPLGVDLEDTADLAKQVALAGVGNLIGLQARMAPSIRYARDLVIQGYVGEVLGATMVASGIAWTSVSDSAHAYMFDATKNATLLSVTTMHALDALQFVVGDLADIRSASAVRRSACQARRHERGDQINDAGSSGHCRRAGKRRGGLDFLSRRCLARRQFSLGDQREKGDLGRTSPLGNLQVLAPTLLGGQDEDTSVAPLAIPPEYDLASDAPGMGGRQCRPALCGICR